MYESSYPGLRYVTFVDGRTRADIVAEMELMLGDQAPSATDIHRHDRGWHVELFRGITDVFRIARSRLASVVPQPSSC